MFPDNSMMSVEKESDQLRRAIKHSLLLSSSNDSHDALLQKYLNGEHYDCTFVCKSEDGADEAGDKIRKVVVIYASHREKLNFVNFKLQKFKCHRLILSAASPAFDRMLFGDFKEAKKGCDEQIEIKGVSDRAFDSVMKYVLFL